MAQITFPYVSMDAAIKDGFAKIGGPSEAYRFIVNGYKGTIWRKESNSKRQDRVKVALELLKAQEEKKGTKAERQLDRK